MLTYNKMESYYSTYSFGDYKETFANRIIQKAENLIGGDNIKIFYPKNLFAKDKNFELYLFLNNNILRISVEADTFITTSIFNKNNVEKVTLKENYKNDLEKLLEIKFTDGEIFQFNSNNDTTESHREELVNLIKQVYSQFTFSINI